VREIELRPGVDPGEFERFVAEEWYRAWRWRGVRLRVLKGDRGARVGKYLLLMEFDDVATRDRYFPPPGGPSEATRRLLEAVGTVEKRRRALMGRGAWTDYVAVDEAPMPRPAA
jgi:hypothetical protein